MEADKFQRLRLNLAKEKRYLEFITQAWNILHPHKWFLKIFKLKRTPILIIIDSKFIMIAYVQKSQ